MEKYGTARQATYDNIIRRMCIACWITKAANTHPEYEILIAFAVRQCLRGLASLLRLRTFACRVVWYFVLQTKPSNVLSLTISTDHTITDILKRKINRKHLQQARQL